MDEWNNIESGCDRGWVCPRGDTGGGGREAPPDASSNDLKKRRKRRRVLVNARIFFYASV